MDSRNRRRRDRPVRPSPSPSRGADATPDIRPGSRAPRADRRTPAPHGAQKPRGPVRRSRRGGAGTGRGAGSSGGGLYNYSSHPPVATPSSAAQAQQAQVEIGSVAAISVFLWCGALLLYFSLGFYATGLMYDVWIEVGDGSSAGETVERIAGKGTTQWLLLSITTFLGIASAVCLSMRLFGSRSAPPWFKLAAIVGTLGMAVVGKYSFDLFMAATEHVRSNPSYRLGAGAEYTRDAFTYTMISLSAMVVHEALVRVVQEMRIRRHVRAEAARTLAQVRGQPEAVQHAFQLQAIIKQVFKAGRHTASVAGAGGPAAETNSGDVAHMHALTEVDVSAPAAGASSAASGSGAVLHALTNPNPPNSRATGSKSSSSGGGAHDEHIGRLVARLLVDKDRLSPAQLNLLVSLVVFMYTVQMGALAYARIEGWELRQGLEFAVVTTATIGYGNAVPKTTLGRALLFLYFPLGFGVMTYTIGLLWTQLFTQADEHIRQVYLLLALYVYRPLLAWRRRRVINAVAARRHRVHITRHITTKKRQARLQNMRESVTASNNVNGPGSSSSGGGGNVEMTTPFSPSLAPLAMGMGMGMALASSSSSAPAASHPPPLDIETGGGEVAGVAQQLSPESAAAHAAAELQERNEVAALDAEERAIDAEESAALSAMDSVSVLDSSKNGPSTNYKLALSCAFVMLLLLGGAAVFHYYETTWTYFESVYFCFCTVRRSPSPRARRTGK